MCWTAEELREKHEEVSRALEAQLQARKDRERDEWSTAQPEDAPETDLSLVGTRIEVLTNLEEEGKTYKQWLPALITSMSDGLVTKPDKAGHQRKVKEGWYLLEYDDGLMAWAHLAKGDFNCARMGAWRLDLDPASASPSEEAPEAGPMADSDDEPEGVSGEESEEGEEDYEEDSEESC